MSNEKNGREVILSVRHVDISFEVGHKKKFDAVKGANFDIYIISVPSGCVNRAQGIKQQGPMP